MNRFKPLHGFFALAFGLSLGLSSCTSMLLDRGVSAADGGASTVFLSGCGNAPQRGYVFCEIRENSNLSTAVTVQVPNASCKRTNCTEFQVIDKDGNFGFAGGIPKGQSSVVLPLSVITQSSATATQTLDGEYTIAIRTYFTGPDGEEYQSLMRGRIRIVILRADYQPIGCNDPNVVWETKLGPKGICKLQWTSKLRSAKCGDCSGLAS